MKRTKDLISVIIPCKNKKSIHDFCLKSLKAQSYQNYEVIIKEGPFVNINRNLGFMEAKGEFIFFLDADINLKKDCFLLMKQTLDRHPDCSIAYCDYSRTGQLKGTHRACPWNFLRLKRTNYISTMSLIRSDDFLGFDENLKRFHDWELWIRMGLVGKKGVYVPGILFVAYYASGCISAQGKASSAAAADVIWKKHRLMQYDPNVYKKKALKKENKRRNKQ